MKAAQRADKGPQTADKGPQRADKGPQRADKGPQTADKGRAQETARTCGDRSPAAAHCVDSAREAARRAHHQQRLAETKPKENKKVDGWMSKIVPRREGETKKGVSPGR